MLKLYKNISLMLMLAFGGVAMAQDYSGVMNNYLEANKSTLQVTSDDVSNMKIYNQVFTRHNKVTHVYAVQQVNGIEVYNAIANLAIKDGKVAYISNDMQRDMKSRVNTATPALNPLEAAASAASRLGLGNGDFSIIRPVSSQEFLLSNGGVSLEQVPVKLVYQPLENEIRLAWDLSIHTMDGLHIWSVRVDAQNGEILQKSDWLMKCSFESHNHNFTRKDVAKKSTFSLEKKQAPISSAILADEQYNVYPVPVESPAHGDRAIITEPQDLLASPFGWHDADGNDGPEFTFTRGNNVWAKEDQAGNNGGGQSPDGGDDLIFDFPIDLTLEPEDYLDASTTNLFYWNNIMHDVFFNYGFDEASGNFQQTNYTGDGLGNDFVFADAQDGSGTNNATFSRTSDGVNPRMSMFLWNPTSVPNFEVNAPSSIAGTYGFSSAAFGESFPVDGLTGDLALAEDDDTTGDPNDLCDPIENGDDVDGKIAVVRRGECNFTAKVLEVQNAGAIACIVINNVPTPIINLGGADAAVTIPSGMISMADGDALLAALAAGDDVNVTISAPAPTGKDGSLDNGIIAHEYGHGISIRLTGGASNAGCISNAEQMGEGWSDYFGLWLTIEPGDTPEDIRGIGTYATGAPITSQGIRPAAYSTDFAVNDLTYADVADTANISQPHGIGTIWSTMLWDMTWLMIDEFGYDDDLYTGTGGNNMALSLVVDALKLQPCNAGFESGRDAILAAVDLDDDITDKTLVKCIVWTAFSDRGMGYSASQGSPASRTDGVEAFDMPPLDELNCDETASVDDNGLGIFSVYPNPSNGDITINVATGQGEGSVTIFDINGRQVYTQKATLEGAVNVRAQGLASGIYILNVNGATASFTTKLIIE